MGIEKWSTSAGSNNMAPPDGWPGGMLPSQVEPTGRQMMASIASWYQAAEWINYNFPVVYSSSTVFTISTNVTALYHVGRRVQATDGSTSVFGTITASAFTSLTTVTVVWDSGVLQTGVTIVYVGITSAVNTSAPNQSASLLSANNSWTGSNAYSGGVSVTRASGVPLTVSSASGATALALDTGTATNQSQLTLAATGSTTGKWAIGLTGTPQFAITDVLAGTSRLLLSTAGNFVINQPSSGAAVSITGAASSALGNSALVVSGSSTTGQSRGIFISAGTNSSDDAFRIQNAAQTVNYFGIRGDGSWFGGPTASQFTIATTGAVGVGVPATAATSAFTTTGQAGTSRLSAALSAVGANTSGQSWGAYIQAGTTAADSALLVNNATNSLNYFQVRGDGVVQGNDGTNLLELGYKDVPLNVQSSNYQLIAADRGKAVQAGASITITAPSGVFSGGAAITIFVGSGATVTIAQGAGLTMQWAGNGASTGSRTLTGAGMVTILYATASVALISGAGLT